MMTDNHDQPAEVPSRFVLPLHVGFHQSSDEDDHPNDPYERVIAQSEKHLAGDQGKVTNQKLPDDHEICQKRDKRRAERQAERRAGFNSLTTKHRPTRENLSVEQRAARFCAGSSPPPNLERFRSFRLRHQVMRSDGSSGSRKIEELEAAAAASKD